MRTISALTILLIAGCGTAPAPEPDPMPSTSATTSWSTTLQANPGYAEVRGTAEARSNASGTAVSVGFAEAYGTTGTVRPWHVHRGRCGNDQGIVGDPNAYPPLRPGSNFAATASATLNVPLTPGGEYFVNIHRSPTELSNIVACGNFRQTM